MKVFAEALRAVWRRRLLWLIQVAGNLAAVVAVWWWLGLPDATAAEIALSVVAAVVIVVVFSWLHAATLAAYYEQRGIPWIATLRRTRGVLMWGVFVGLLIFDAVTTSRGWVRAGAFAITLLFFAPAGSRGSVREGSAPAIYRDWRYYTGCIAALIVGGYVPWRLLRWNPGVSGLRAEAVSFALRFAVAYLLVITSWLFVAALMAELGRLRREAGGQVPDHPLEPVLGDQPR